MPKLPKLVSTCFTVHSHLLPYRWHEAEMHNAGKLTWDSSPGTVHPVNLTKSKVPQQCCGMFTIYWWVWCTPDKVIWRKRSIPLTFHASAERHQQWTSQPVLSVSTLWTFAPMIQDYHPVTVQTSLYENNQIGKVPPQSRQFRGKIWKHSCVDSCTANVTRKADI